MIINTHSVHTSRLVTSINYSVKVLGSRDLPGSRGITRLNIYMKLDTVSFTAEVGISVNKAQYYLTDSLMNLSSNNGLFPKFKYNTVGKSPAPGPANDQTKLHKCQRLKEILISSVRICDSVRFDTSRL
eukprot:g50716.t1